jgi:hypothetical protein
VEGEVERETTFQGGGGDFPALKVLMQFSLVLLVKVSERESKALESEEGKGLGREEGKALDDTCKERILYIFIDEYS